MGVVDFLFGSDALKKAAGTKSDDKSTSSGNSDAGLDMGRLAQESADRQKSQETPIKPAKSPLSTTMTPMGKKDKK